MKTRDVLFPLIIVPVGLLFALICVLLFLNKENKKLLAAKFRMGAFLLSFSYFVSCGQAQQTCYIVAPPDNVVELSKNDSLQSGDTIKGQIFRPAYKYFSVDISDSSGVLQSGFLTVAGDSTGWNRPEFYFILNPNLEPGNYQLKIYGEEKQRITRLEAIKELPLIIRKRKN